MSVTSTPPRPTDKPASNSFGSVLWAEWAKFRTVRGLDHRARPRRSGHLLPLLRDGGWPQYRGLLRSPRGVAVCASAPRTVVPTGPGGEGVADTYEFVHRTLTRDGTVTGRDHLACGRDLHQRVQRPRIGPPPRTGVMGQGRAPTHPEHQARVGLCRGDGHRRPRRPVPVQLHARPPGVAGRVTTSTPSMAAPGSIRRHDHRLHLHQRAALDRSWLSRPIGAAGNCTGRALRHLARQFQGYTGYPTLATAAIDHITVDGSLASNSWLGQDIGTGRTSFYPTVATGSYHYSGTSVVVSGSGDIAPAVVQGPMGTHTASSSLMLGLIVGLFMVIVVAAMFVTASTPRVDPHHLHHDPARGRVLAAKGLVVGALPSYCHWW